MPARFSSSFLSSLACLQAQKALRTQIFGLRTIKRYEQNQTYYRQISNKTDKIKHEAKKVMMTKVTNSGAERCSSGHLILFFDKKQTLAHYRDRMSMVMKMKYNFSPEQYEEIKKARRQNRDKQIDKRLQVLELRSEGKGLGEIADLRQHRAIRLRHLLENLRPDFEPFS